ncbi:HAD domain-containing protein [Kribbella sp. NBC_00382]|uniref:HAD domain-containing protein n=1 Tax=Kribbella sp. NBC_00382 TaxID=2975967 RepID=UPI002E24F44F
MEPRPYLLLDVDGPLNPYRAKTVPPGYRLEEIVEGEKTWKLLLNQQHGAELTALTDLFELVWATTWEHGANRLIAPRIGLPSDLPVIVWPPGARAGAERSRRSWKTPHVARWVGGRPFVWIDDEINRYDRMFLESTPGISAFHLHRVEANCGLAPADFTQIAEWAATNC